MPPNGKVIFESLAIISHIIENFDGLAPKVGDLERDKYNQYMALMATSIYPAYHRQYHTYQYGPSSSFDYIRECAREVNDLLFEQLDAFTCDAVEGEIINTIEQYEPRVQLTGVKTVPIYEGNKIAVTVQYKIVGQPIVETINFVLQRPE